MPAGITLSGLREITRRIRIPSREDPLWAHLPPHGAEAALAIHGADGTVLLQRKRHYPSEIYRLPSGRLRPGETAPAAVERETWEETGLIVRRALLLATIHVIASCGADTRSFDTHLFLVETEPGTPVPRDASEGICDYKPAGAPDLRRAWWALRRLVPPLECWGRFRALPLAALGGLRRGGNVPALRVDS